MNLNIERKTQNLFAISVSLSLIEVLFHTFYCNWGMDWKSFVLPRTSLYIIIEVRNIEVPLYRIMLMDISTLFRRTKSNQWSILKPKTGIICYFRHFWGYSKDNFLNTHLNLNQSIFQSRYREQTKTLRQDSVFRLQVYLRIDCRLKIYVRKSKHCPEISITPGKLKMTTWLFYSSVFQILFPKKGCYS